MTSFKHLGSEGDIEIIRQVYSGINRNNIDVVLSLMDADITRIEFEGLPACLLFGDIFKVLRFTSVLKLSRPVILRFINDILAWLRKITPMIFLICDDPLIVEMLYSVMQAAMLSIYKAETGELLSYQLSNGFGRVLFKGLPVGIPLRAIATNVGYAPVKRNL